MNLLLASSVSVVYTLENEAMMMLQRVVTAQSEEMSEASRINEEMKTSWNQLSDVNAMLRSQLKSVEAKGAQGQQDSSMRSPDDEDLRGVNSRPALRVSQSG